MVPSILKTSMRDKSFWTRPLVVSSTRNIPFDGTLIYSLVDLTLSQELASGEVGIQFTEFQLYHQDFVSLQTDTLLAYSAILQVGERRRVPTRRKTCWSGQVRMARPYCIAPRSKVARFQNCIRFRRCTPSRACASQCQCGRVQGWFYGTINFLA